MKNKLVSWDDHLEKKYGKPGTENRIKYEEACQKFIKQALKAEVRKQKN